MYEGGGSRPIPDPTLLTTQQLLRELHTLREILEARMEGMDRAQAMLQALVDRVPTDVAMKIGQLRELVEEKFRGVHTQLAERDARLTQDRATARAALDTALQAAKELLAEQYRAAGTAVNKSEAAISKQIDQQATQMATTTNAMESKITDLKDRLTRIEGRGSGFTASWGIAVALVGMLLGIGGILLAVMQ